ncbi:Nudix hydrolase [Seminavis robusta]|uniref:Nudix hydrolase n=1 Tax=Seminavis robusta TaxID=568900 RepID=A0A9N8HP59_9STRA|nr:Nudix hydrolase [Seminavis robusta]|eukprot:Sro1147_g246390.1 Nudix hydrolase (347) ;mRNA; f:23015-24055
MKLLDRIRNLDASRRVDVVSKYIPVLLVEHTCNLMDTQTKTMIGHIHTDLIETLRDRLEENLPHNSKSVFRLPKPAFIEETTTLTRIRNRYFGLVVDKSPTQPLADARTAALERFTNLLLDCKVISNLHSDRYPITDPTIAGHGEILATVNRNAAPYLGVTSIGVHLLCYVKTNDTVSLWLAQRAANKSHHALLWDPTVAGGQPASMGLFDNVIKEAGEEAGIPSELVARNAVATGCLSQMTCKPDGTCMKQSLYYTWDMQVPNDFVPEAADGEVAQFELCSAEQLEYDVREGTRLRPAMILVVTDFLIRHGIIAPDKEPDYANILAAMHQEQLVFEYADKGEGCM